MADEKATKPSAELEEMFVCGPQSINAFSVIPIDAISAPLRVTPSCGHSKAAQATTSWSLLAPLTSLHLFAGEPQCRWK